MNRRKIITSKRTILVTIVATILIFSICLETKITTSPSDNCQTTKEFDHTLENPFSFALTPHDPISITSDSGLEVFPGSGTVEDPYIIQEYSITTTNNKGIYITGTTKYFNIRNCYVDATYYGIYIDDVADGTVTVANNMCNNNNIYGIYLRYSVSSTVINNTCSNNGDGIVLDNSGSSIVANNTFTNCGLNIHEITVDAYLSYTVENNWVNGKKNRFLH